MNNKNTIIQTNPVLKSEKNFKVLNAQKRSELVFQTKPLWLCVSEQVLTAAWNISV